MPPTPQPPSAPSAPSRAQIKADALVLALTEHFPALVNEMAAMLPGQPRDAIEMAVLRGLVQPTLVDTFEATRSVGREVLGGILTEVQHRLLRRARAELAAHPAASPPE